MLNLVFEYSSIPTMQATINQFKPKEITLMIGNAFEGDNCAMNNLIKILYPDLKMIASGIRHKQIKVSRTLNTTSLVNEAFLKLCKYGINVKSRKHFFCIVAKAMRQILINSANQKLCKKHLHLDVNIDDFQIESDECATFLLQLDEIIEAIGRTHPRIGQIFDLKYFIGLSEQEIADELKISKRTVRRDWLIAKQTIAKLL